jgi:hypothetical protein
MWMTLGHVADMSMAVAWGMAGILQGSDATVVRRLNRSPGETVTKGAI